MRKDEFNELKIINEGENPDFEYGNTQDSESTSYQDNNDRLRDEINDNPTSNGSKRPYENKKKERKDKSEKDGSGKGSSHGGTSVGTSVVTVAGASMIAVSTLSVLVGINIFFNAKFKMDRIEPTPTSISYELELTDIKNDECIIKLENKDYSDSKTLIEGPNSGEFTGLTPLTEYSITVIDLTYNNYVLYSDNITTTEEEVIPPLTTYTVTFVTNGGTEIPSQTVNEGDKVSKPTDPTREYYTFEGWYSDSDLTQEYDFNTPVTSDISIYAKWEIVTFNVEFVTNGGTEVPSQTVEYGATVEKPDDPTKENYTFKGWFSDSGLTEKYDFASPVTSDLILYADWEEVVPTTILFDANGGEGEQEPGYADIGEEFILPECTFTAPAGYAFDCWQLSGTEDKYNPGEGYLVESQGPLTFLAVWGEAATIEFYPGIGAQGNVTSIKYVIGKEYTIPNGEEFFTAPENKEFDYWFDDMYSEQRHAGDIITIEDTYYSFTGHWKYLDGLTFTVTFETNGGSEVESQVVNAGTNATKPDDPTKDDCIFEGWYSNSELTNSYNFITPVTEDITLYAKWSTTYSVSGEGFNGFPNSTVDYATESEINGVTLQVSAYSCYFNDPDDGHGLWIPLGYDSQSPEDCISYLANKTPINGSIKNIAITVGPSAYGGTSSTTLHVTFGTEPMLEHLTSGTTITYDTDATLVVECNSDGFSYFNITNVSENGLVIESIVVTYYVN